MAQQRSQEWGVFVELWGQWGEAQGGLGLEAHKKLERQGSNGEADSGRTAAAQGGAGAYGWIPPRSKWGALRS